MTLMMRQSHPLWSPGVLVWGCALVAVAAFAEPGLAQQGPGKILDRWTQRPPVRLEPSSAVDGGWSPSRLSPGLLTDPNGQTLHLPPVCTSQLPGYAYEPPPPHARIAAPPTARFVPGNPPGDRAVAGGQRMQQAIQEQQWRDALRAIVQDDGTLNLNERGYPPSDPTPGSAPRFSVSNAVSDSGSSNASRRLDQVARYQSIAAGQVARADWTGPHSGSPPPQTAPRSDRDSPQAQQLYNPHAQASADRAAVQRAARHLRPDSGTLWDECDLLDPHAELFAKTLFPSATECAPCHQQIFDQWASSSHAYAALSPMFHRFEDTINKLSSGTIGYFCMRCHAPVATTVGHRRDQPIWDGPRVYREGVTCIACHHIEEITLKTNGERRIEPGTILDPVTGSSSGTGIEAVHKYADHFKVKSDPADPRNGQLMHRRVFQFKEISESTFCISCHQVAVQPGIKLEVVWDQYRGSPAHREGISCQDCHMGRVPGVAEGYSLGPAAVVEGRVVDPLRKHSNHMFYGPGYSIAHPGIFPHDPAQDRWTVPQWLEFDWRAGWGTDPFEQALPVPHAPIFPPVWSNADDRYDARQIVERNLQKLEYKRQLRRQVLENGSRIDGPYFEGPVRRNQDLSFHYCVQNISKGHNLPSGSLGAQPQLWLNVVLIGPDGLRLWESGYLDSQGDLADRHSADVLNRRMSVDRQLFNLQTKFLTTNVKGTDREMYLPINVDIDQLPFLRPATQPVTVLNHPPFIRMEAHSIPALGQRKAKYHIPGQLLSQPGTYRLSVRLRSRAEPIYFMKFVQATPEMIRSMNQWIVDVHPATVVFEVR